MAPDPKDPTTDGQPILVAVCRQRLHDAAKVQWKLSWESNPHGKHLRQIHAVQIASRPLPRPSESRQFRNCAVANRKDSPGYLGAFKAAPTIECPCGLGRQDSDHILTS